MCAAGARDEDGGREREKDVRGGYEGGRGEQKKKGVERGMSPTFRMWWEGKELRGERGERG